MISCNPCNPRFVFLRAKYFCGNKFLHQCLYKAFQMIPLLLDRCGGKGIVTHFSSHGIPVCLTIEEFCGWCLLGDGGTCIYIYKYNIMIG